MNTLNKHYTQLLGLDKSWQVESVELKLANNRVDIVLVHKGGQVLCPVCKKQCGIADHAPERSWRHLDTMQFETRLTARVPRSRCPECGVKTTAVPWAGKHSRFTLLFEAFAIEVLKACTCINRACDLTHLSWRGMHEIMKRAVARGLERRELDDVEYVGIDEKSFRKGHRYVTTLNDLSQGRVLEVVEGRDEAAASGLWDTLSQEQRDNLKAVSIDMWKAFINSVEKHVPDADIVHDRFHISQHLGMAVDKVRRQEHKILMAQKDDRLKGTKQLWLFNPANMSDSAWLAFEPLKQMELKTARAWAIKEQFRWFWQYTYAGWAERFFKQWHSWAVRSRLRPIRDVAQMLKHHLKNILNYFKHRITNAVSEGLNSRIQSIKSAARGFRAFENYRIRILFYCGKMKLMPKNHCH